MTPTSAHFDLVLDKAKTDNRVTALLNARNDSPHAYMIGLNVTVIRRQGDELLFQVIFGYKVANDDLEKNDDVRVFVPWNFRTDQFGAIPDPQVF